MSYKSKTSVTKVIALPSGYEATIQALRKGDKEYLRSILLGSAKEHGSLTTVDDKTTQVIEQEMDSAAYTTAIIQRGVAVDPVSHIPLWTLDGEDGSILPLTAAVINDLDGEDADTLIKAIVKFSEAPDKSGTGTSQSPALDHADSEPEAGPRDRPRTALRRLS